ncbi:MAG: hypothetical protein MK193_04285 [Lentisphaeria bacterium]|nr:hypothetical protein [Lentisphaeria bacterium]
MVNLKVLLLSVLCMSVLANNNIRNWTTKDGVVLRGEVINVDIETGDVILRIDENEERSFEITKLSDEDQHYLDKWIRIEHDLVEIVIESGGEYDQVLTDGDYPTDLYIYYPSAFENSEETLPALILFSPSGNGKQYLKNYVQASEANSVIVISCGTFRNSRNKKLGKEFLARYKEVLAFITENINFDKERLFIGGTSGGAMRAFNYSYLVPANYKGVFSNGGWLGGKDFYSKNYPDHLRVAIVNGDADKGANHWVKSDIEVLKKHKAIVKEFYFKGGHQLQPPEVATQALAWLIQAE